MLAWKSSTGVQYCIGAARSNHGLLCGSEQRWEYREDFRRSVPMRQAVFVAFALQLLALSVAFAHAAAEFGRCAYSNRTMHTGVVR